MVAASAALKGPRMREKKESLVDGTSQAIAAHPSEQATAGAGRALGGGWEGRVGAARLWLLEMVGA